MAGIYRVHPVTLGASTQIDGVQDIVPDHGIQSSRQTADGNTDPWFGGIDRISPSIQFTTTSIATALAYTGTRANSGAIQTWDVPVGENGLKPASGAVRSNLASACIYPIGVQARDGEVASLQVAAKGYGTRLVQTKNSSQVAHASGATEFWTLGPVYVDGTRVSGVQEVGIDFGNDVQETFGDGAVVPLSQALMSHLPSATIGMTDPDSLFAAMATTSGVGQGGKCTDVDIYLRRKSCDGLQNTGAIRFQIANAIVAPVGGGGGTGPRTVSFRVEPIRTANNVDPIVLDTDATIS